MTYIHCPSQVKLDSTEKVYLGIVCPRISAKNEKVCPESAKIVWRKRKRHPDMLPIPCPGQVQMFTPHTEYLGIGGPGKIGRASCRDSESARIAQRKGREIQA